MARELRWKRVYHSEHGHFCYEAETIQAFYLIHCTDAGYYADITVWDGMTLETETYGTLSFCKRVCKDVQTKLDCT